MDIDNRINDIQTNMKILFQAFSELNEKLMRIESRMNESPCVNSEDPHEECIVVFTNKILSKQDILMKELDAEIQVLTDKINKYKSLKAYELGLNIEIEYNITSSKKLEIINTILLEKRDNIQNILHEFNINEKNKDKLIDRYQQLQDNRETTMKLFGLL